MSTEYTTSQIFPSGRMVSYAGHHPHFTDEHGNEFDAETQDAIECQRLAEIYVNRDVLCCDSALVGDLSRKSMDGFQIEDWENLYPDPSDWTVEQCREYIEDHGGDVDDLPPVDPFAGWPSVEGLANQISAFFRPSMDGSKINYNEGFDWDEDDEGVKTLEFGIDEDGEVYFETDGTGTIGDYEASYRVTLPCPPLATIAAKLLDECKAKRLEDFDPDEDDIVEQYRNAVSDCAEPAEVYEWWRVSDWLCRQLHDIGEVVIDNGYGSWWGRTCTGQAMIMDGTLQAIASRHVERTRELVG